MSKFAKAAKDCDHSGSFKEKFCNVRGHLSECFQYQCTDCGSCGDCEIGEEEYE